MDIRTVNVEILRAGPRHNQLLSPLTQYLVTCNDSAAGVLTLPRNYEQAIFERTIQELRYDVASDDPTRLHDVLEATGTEIGEILGQIPDLPGLIAQGGQDVLTHVRLLFSASELSLLPFELSKVPAGPGIHPEEWLSLVAPVCVTRRNRGVRTDRVSWTSEPRILFVSGPDVEDAFDQHKQALIDSLSPWTGCPRDTTPPEYGAATPLLQVLPNATLDEVEEAMRSRPTHVHILAHGEDDFEDRHGRYGVALNGDTVNGTRLATALTNVGDHDEHLPTVVTLATCDSSYEASPIPPDPSVALALHTKGIPFVVASQFPLSIDGSVPFVRSLYSDLLWGRHPFHAMYEVRRALFVEQSDDYHDWASLTIHEALPDNLQPRLDDLRYWQSRRAHETAIRRVEALLRDPPSGDWTIPDNTVLRDRMRAVEMHAERLPLSGPYAVECTGLRAAGWKRLAEVEYRLATKSNLDLDAKKALYENCHRNLTRSLSEYHSAEAALLGSSGESVNRKVTLHWILTQVLSMRVIMGNSFDEVLWATAKRSAEVDRNALVGDGLAWAHVSLTELSLLRLADADLDSAERERVAEAALEHAHRITEVSTKASEQAVKTGRQIRRYVEFWGRQFAKDLAHLGISSREGWYERKGLHDVAAEIVQILGDPPDEIPDPDRCESVED